MTTTDNFMGDGIVITDFGATDDVGRDVALQVDGKIVVFGGSRGDFALARYNIDGSLDTSFTSDGIITTAIGTRAGGGSIALQADGKIVVGGGSQNGDYQDFTLARYNSNGTLDTNFDGDGIVATSLSTGDDAILGITLQADGRILATGASWNGSNKDLALTRYNSDGSLDDSFNGNGKLTFDFGVGNDFGCGIAVQKNDNKIVVAGSCWNGNDWDFALMRFNSNGSLDTSFDGDGKLTTNLGSHDTVRSVTLQTDGKIVVAGNSYIGSNYNFSLARYNSDGSLDKNFNGDGKVTTVVGAGNSAGWKVAIQTDDKVVLSGWTDNGSNLSNLESALVRYNSDGSLDTSFDGDGIIIQDLGGSSDYCTGLVLQADSKIVLAGQTSNGNNGDFVLVRYNNDGSLDVNSPPTGTITISGTAKQGEALTATHTLADADGLGTVTYQWKANNTVIGTGNSYTLTQAEVGKTITAIASYTDNQSTAESVSSATTAIVENINDVPIGTVSITGLAIQGEILTAFDTLVDIDGLGVISYSWLANGSTVAIGGSYTLTSNEVGKTISATASYTDLLGHAESVSSLPTSVVAAPINTPPTGTATAVLAAGTEDTAYTINASNLLQGFSDADAGNTLSVTNLAANNGTLVNNNNGIWTFTPTANYNGAVALTYTVTDGTASIAVGCRNAVH